MSKVKDAGEVALDNLINMYSRLAVKALLRSNLSDAYDYAIEVMRLMKIEEDKKCKDLLNQKT